MMRLTLLLAAAIALPALASAQTPAPTTPMSTPGAGAKAADVKVNQLIVYGNDPCPRSTADQITICGRRPEEDRYRIPRDLRDNPSAAERESFTNKVEQLEIATRTGTGSCSAVGPGAGAGCLAQMIRESREEWAKSDIDWVRLIEQARQERLSTIDKDSEEIERAEQARNR